MRKRRKTFSRAPGLISRTKKNAKVEAVSRGSGNVFTDLGFPKKEAADLQVKADLTLKIHQHIKELGLTQVRAAERLGLSQPDVSKLMTGRHSGFSVERLLTLLNALDVDVEIVVHPRSNGRKVRIGTIRVREVASF